MRLFYIFSILFRVTAFIELKLTYPLKDSRNNKQNVQNIILIISNNLFLFLFFAYYLYIIDNPLV